MQESPQRWLTLRISQRNGLFGSAVTLDNNDTIAQCERRRDMFKHNFGNADLPHEEDDVVSVIIPVYNYGDRLRGAVESVLNQTHQNWELIMVDDGSTDSSWAEMEQCARLDSRIRLAKQPNMGLSAARNTGIRLSKGQYISLLDPDDRYRKDKLKRQIEFMQSHPYLGMCYANAMLCDEGKEFPTLCPDFDRRLLLRANIIPCQSVLLRRTLVDVVGPFNEGLAEIEDYEYWLRAAELFGIARVPELISYDITRHPGQKSVVAQNERPNQWQELHKEVTEWFSNRHAIGQILVSIATHSKDAFGSAATQSLPNIELVGDGFFGGIGVFSAEVKDGWRFSSPDDLARMLWQFDSNTGKVSDKTGNIVVLRMNYSCMPTIDKRIESVSAVRC